MRIAVIGAGALGLYYGALLQRGGHELRFLLRRDYDAITRHGLQVFSPHGDFHLGRVEGFRRSAEMGEVDLVLVGLKTFANARLVELCAPLMVNPQTLVLTLQNGLGNEELLAAAFGAGRVLGGIAFLCSNRGEPGTVHHLDQGRIRIGELAPGVTPRLAALAESFSACGIPCEAVSDLVKARWEKLVWNIPFNGLSALLQRPTGQLLASPGMHDEIAALMHEVVAAGNAQGLTSPIDGPAFVARMLEVTAGMGDYRPSMMIDRLDGHPLELHSIYGLPLQRAASKGVEMPRTSLLHAELAAGENVPAAP